jgi:hypothetical protein
MSGKFVNLSDGGRGKVDRAQTRDLLGRDRLERAAVPAPKISLAPVRFLTRPYPDWWNDPQPPRPTRKRGR